MVGNGADLLLRQHRTIPALRLKHRSDGCGTASASVSYTPLDVYKRQAIVNGKGGQTVQGKVCNVANLEFIVAL